MLAMLWAACPLETAALCAAAVLSAAGLGVLLALIWMPGEPEEMEEEADADDGEGAGDCGCV